MTNEIPVLGTELASLDLGDLRLAQRGWQVIEALAAKPTASFPEAMETEAALEGFYRFINNERVTPEALLAPHHAETCARAEQAQRILALHDTSEVQYQGELRRQGLGRLSGKQQGYFAHVALAVGTDPLHRPLGVLGMMTYTRDWQVPQSRTYASRKRAQSGKESGRWRQLVDTVEQRAEQRFEIIHVMDREADNYELLAHLCKRNASFVVRVSHDRILEPEGTAASMRLETRLGCSIPMVDVSRRAEISRRGNKGRGPETVAIHPPRAERAAQVAISAVAVTVQATDCPDPTVPPNLRLHCVQVDEIDPPANVEPLRWRLWTRLPIDEPEQLLAIVDIYRARWIVEEFFKALKTGCALERRQQETGDSLLNVLALLIPVAWRLLLIRHLAQQAPQAPATQTLTDAQLDVLRAFAPRPPSSTPTMHEALLAIASLGGHIRNNGAPGWMVLGRGFDKFLLLEAAWSAAKRCDR